MQPHYIQPDDLVIDPLDGEIRRVLYVNEYSVYMHDGGVMGADEINHIYTQEEINILISGGYNENDTRYLPY